MYRILSFILFIIAFNANLLSQVVNIEKMREQSDKPLSGRVELTFDINRSISTILTAKNTTRIQYAHLKNTYLWLADLQFMQVDTIRYINNGFFHFRYNYNFSNEWLNAEAFTQIQFNRIQKILRRFLWGGGLRYAVFTAENQYSVFFGNSVLYEFELYIDKTFQDLLRGNLYLSAVIKPSQTFSFTNTVYFQPRIDNWSNYRITSEISIDAVIIKQLSFRTRFNYFYDSKPAPSVQKTFYSLHNGIAYKF